MKGTMTSTFSATTMPSAMPMAVPNRPTNAPWIMKIFMIQGALVGIIGTLAGVSIGVLVAMNIDVIIPFIERMLGMQFISKEIYFISALPSDLRWPDVAVIAAVSVGLAFIATLYPSFAASRVKPAEALRYE